MSWSGTFQSFLENFEYLNKNYSQKYVASELNVNLKDSKYFKTGELKKVCDFQLLTELLQRIRKEVLNIDIKNGKFNIIKTLIEQWK